MSVLEKLTIAVAMDSRDAEKGIDRLDKSTSGLGSKLGKALGVTAKAGVVGLVGGLIAGSAAGLKFNRSVEQTTIAMGTMLGSTSKAKTLIGEVTKMAASTPFEFPELADATKRLVAYGVSAKTAVPLMRRLGDVSAALNIPLGEMSDLYGKMKVSGRITMEDMNQLAGRGIPIYAALAKQLGVGEEKIRGLVESGKIGFPQIEQAIVDMTDKGGMFSGMMDAQSRSFDGLLSTIKDGIAQAFGKVLLPAFGWLVDTGMPAVIAAMPKLEAALSTAFSVGSAAIGRFIEAARGIVGFIKDKVVGPVKTALSAIGDVFDDVISPAITTGLATIKQLVKDHLPDIDLSGLAGKLGTQALGWAKAVIDKFTEGMETGDWSGLGEALGKGIVRALEGLASLTKKITATFADWFSKVDWMGIGITVGKQLPTLLIGLAAGILDMDFAGLFRGVIAHWPTILIGLITIAFMPAKLLGPIGRILARIPLAGKLLEWAFLHIAAFTKGLGGKILDALGFMGKAFLDGFRSVFPAVGKGFAAALEIFPFWIKYNAVLVKDAAVNLMKGLGRGIADGTGAVLTTIGETIGWIIKPFADAGGWLVGHGVSLLRGLLNGIGSVASTMAAWLRAHVIDVLRVTVSQGLKGLVSDIGSVLSVIETVVKAPFIAAKIGVQTVVSLIKAALRGDFSAMPGIIKSALGNLGSLLYGAGKAVMQGLLNGIKAAWSATAKFLSGIGAKIKSLKGPIDKDRVLLYQEGAAIIEGLGKGMQAQIPGVLGIASGLAKGISGAMSGMGGNVSMRAGVSGSGASSMSAGARGVPITINNHIYGASNPDAVAEKVVQKTFAQLRARRLSPVRVV